MPRHDRGVCFAGLSSTSLHPRSVWTRPGAPNEDWVKPSYVPWPVYEPPQPRDPQPLYAPAPEFRPAELPEQTKELPSGPKM